jgi:hypothetical protein
MRIAASWPRAHSVPLKQVMQEAMQAYAGRWEKEEN